LAQAQADQRCFPETGFCISGTTRAYWKCNGGLPVFGYPIGPAQQETIEGRWTGRTQWFERDRLENHANKVLGVLAGASALALWSSRASAGRRPYLTTLCSPAAATSARPASTSAGRSCATGRLTATWSASATRITREHEETIEGRTYTVQYFERRRMEWHPEYAGTPSEVLLGLLGRQISSADRGCGPWFFAPAPALCP